MQPVNLLKAQKAQCKPRDQVRPVHDVEQTDPAAPHAVAAGRPLSRVQPELLQPGVLALVTPSYCCLVTLQQTKTCFYSIRGKVCQGDAAVLEQNLQHGRNGCICQVYYAQLA